MFESVGVLMWLIMAQCVQGVEKRGCSVSRGGSWVRCRGAMGGVVKQ